jgi:hypothetical protein
MKIKNYYVWLAIAYIAMAIIDGIFCVVNFVDQKIWLGLLQLCLSNAFAFVGGIFFEKSYVIKRHNEACDWLHEIAEELREKQKEETGLPFEEFDND